VRPAAPGTAAFRAGARGLHSQLGLKAQSGPPSCNGLPGRRRGRRPPSLGLDPLPVSPDLLEVAVLAGAAEPFVGATLRGDGLRRERPSPARRRFSGPAAADLAVLRARAAGGEPAARSAAGGESAARASGSSAALRSGARAGARSAELSIAACVARPALLRTARARGDGARTIGTKRSQTRRRPVGHRSARHGKKVT